MGVVLPRTDDGRKEAYLTKSALYESSQGACQALDDAAEESVRRIDEEAAREMRASTMQARHVPYAQLEPGGVGSFNLLPAERAVVPVRWTRRGAVSFTECSTHPEAPTGLAVLPGTCEDKEFSSVVVENESGLPVAVDETDLLAIGISEEEVLSLQECHDVLNKQNAFKRALDWSEFAVDCSGSPADSIRVVPSPRSDQDIVVIVHRKPRRAPCSPSELGEPWKHREPSVRTVSYTHLTLPTILLV